MTALSRAPVRCLEHRGFVFSSQGGPAKARNLDTPNQHPKNGPFLRRRVSAPTVGAEVLGGFLWPHLVLEVGP